MSKLIINLGKNQFDIYTLNLGVEVARAAIYTIWTYNPQNNSYPLLYVGQTGDLSERIDAQHHKLQCWREHQINGLYIAIWLMPTTQYTKEQRAGTEQGLIKIYNPICNG